MPTYEYECLSCGIHFDEFQKMSDQPLDKCIACQGTVRRVISGGSGLIFKGSGFYITDYAKGKNTTNPDASAKIKESSKPEGKSTPKKTAKTAAKNS